MHNQGPKSMYTIFIGALFNLGHLRHEEGNSLTSLSLEHAWTCFSMPSHFGSVIWEYIDETPTKALSKATKYSDWGKNMIKLGSGLWGQRACPYNLWCDIIWREDGVWQLDQGRLWTEVEMFIWTLGSFRYHQALIIWTGFPILLLT